MQLHSHTRTIQNKSYDIWRSPDRFTKNPDIAETKEGRLLLVYSDNDQHWSQRNQIITILASDDGGISWRKLSEVDNADLTQGDERLVTPRLTALSDGRLAVIIDHDDFGHFHEAQPCGNWIYWSYDGGRTWTQHQAAAIPGFEPDRIMELPDGSLSVITHLMRGQSMEFAVVMSRSFDGGRTWREYSTVAHDGYHRFCEGALVLLDGGREYAVLMRENHCAGFACYVAFSRDGGRNWTQPQQLPFHFHRPYAKQLADGRVLVTGRNMLGGIGTYAWTGNLKAEAGYYEIGGPMAEYDAYLADGKLVINNGPDYDCHYTLLPPEGTDSEVVFQADMRVEGTNGEAAAFMALTGLMDEAAGSVLSIMPDGISLGGGSADTLHKTDMRIMRHVALHARRGLLTVEVDGRTLINACYYHEGRSYNDFYSPLPGKRMQFGQLGRRGRSFWKAVECRVTNAHLPDYWFAWSGDDGIYPDDYQRRRLTLIHANVHPNQRHSSGGLAEGPDHGYSSWLQRSDGTLVFVDYSNLGDASGKSHLVGARFSPEDV